MSGTDLAHVRTIDGITFGAIGTEKLCRDVDLAAFLEYAKPRDIRELIGRHDGAQHFGSVHVRRTVRRTSMPRGGERVVDVAEFWLTRKQALFIAAKSDTPKAAELLSEVIDRFLAYERGLLDQDRITLYLRDVPDEKWKQLFEHRVGDAITRLYGKTVDWSRGWPPMLCDVVGKLYNHILGRAVADEMRRHKAEDRARGLKMHQRLTPEARQLMLAELSFVETMALQAGSSTEFWARLGNRYEGKPFQLSFVGALDTTKKKTDAAE